MVLETWKPFQKGILNYFFLDLELVFLSQNIGYIYN